MVEPDRTRPMPDNGRQARGEEDAPGPQGVAQPEEAPGDVVVGEIGRMRGEPGASDLAGGAELDPREDAEQMARRVIDDVEHNDEAD